MKFSGTVGCVQGPGALAPVIPPTPTSLPPLGGFSPLPHGTWTPERLEGGVCLSWAGHGGSYPFEAGSPAASLQKTDTGEPLLSPNPRTQSRCCDTLKVTCSLWVGVTGFWEEETFDWLPCPQLGCSHPHIHPPAGGPSCPGSHARLGTVAGAQGASGELGSPCKSPHTPERARPEIARNKYHDMLNNMYILKATKLCA